MTRVLVLPSEHGRGHARRMAVLAKALRAEGAQVLGTQLLARVAREDGLLPDLPALAPLPPLDVGARLWDAQTQGRLPEELARLAAKGPDAVAAWEDTLRDFPPAVLVVDADPWPLAAGVRLGIPTVLVSNFTWGDLAHAWGGDAAWMDALHAGARACELPFGLGLRGVAPEARTPVAHLAEPAPPRSGDPPPARLQAVYAMGLGSPQPPRRLVFEGPTDLWVPRGAALPDLEGPVAVRAMEGPPAARIAEADLVVAKPSYGTVSEAVAARAALALVPRKDGPEDRLVAEALTRHGVAVVAQDGVLAVPDAARVRDMRRAYDEGARWARCDPGEAARAILHAEPG